MEVVEDILVHKKLFYRGNLNVLLGREVVGEVREIILETVKMQSLKDG